MKPLRNLLFFLILALTLAISACGGGGGGGGGGSSGGGDEGGGGDEEVVPEKPELSDLELWPEGDTIYALNGNSLGLELTAYAKEGGVEWKFLEEGEDGSTLTASGAYALFRPDVTDTTERNYTIRVTSIATGESRETVVNVIPGPNVENGELRVSSQNRTYRLGDTMDSYLASDSSTVPHISADVTWSVSPAEGATLVERAGSAMDRNRVADFTATESGLYTITATLPAVGNSPAKTATAYVTVTPEVPIKISVKDGKRTFLAGKDEEICGVEVNSGRFTSSFAGDYETVAPPISGRKVEGNCFLFHPNPGSEGKYTVTFRSSVDTSQSVEVPITVLPEVLVTIDPPLADINVGDSVDLTAEVSGGDGSRGVAWHLASSGTAATLTVVNDGAGRSARFSAAEEGIYTVLVTSTEDENKSAFARITVGLASTDIVEDLGGGVSLTMKKVEGGTFEMGCDSSTMVGCTTSNTASRNTRHSVTLGSGFYIGESEVTQAQWYAVMGDDKVGDVPRHLRIEGCGKSGGNNGHDNGTSDELPMYCVSWTEAQEFIDRLNTKTGNKFNFRLPTEAEWEYAASGGKESHAFLFAGSNSINAVAWWANNIPAAGTQTQPVKGKYPNELGLYDMTGNVWEWVNDRSAAFTADSVVDPQGPETGSNRTVRGGGSSETSLAWLYVYRRDFYHESDYRNNTLGFRLAFTSP
jgi:formylglycine-generating enzyme required for sulfatase activity